MNEHPMSARTNSNRTSREEGTPGTTRTFTELELQAEGLHAELVSLRGNIAAVQQDLEDGHALHLREANQQLLLAALRAETIAEAAVSNRDELAWAAQRDALTDMPNRAMMLDRLTNAIAMAERHHSRIAILFLDLDDFKQINDSYGHDVGDQVVQLVARRLESAVRHSDTVSRHGGDEFLVLVAEVTQASDASLIARKMLSAVAEPARVGEHVLLNLSASIGISIYPEDGIDAAALIRHADAAMYLSKRHAQGQFQFHNPQLSSPVAVRTEEIAHATACPGEASALADHPWFRDLREANEHLVIAAVTARGNEVKAEEALRSQVEFQAMVAHELRGPLTPIRTAADMLRRLPATAPMTDGPLLGDVQILIEKEVIHMATLIDDLLDCSITATGRFRLARESVSLADVLDEVVERCRPAMELKDQKFRMQKAERPLFVHADRLRLAQVFGNLLHNASRYTPAKGRIELLVGGAGESVQVTIKDTGKGITASAMPAIFDLFVRDRPALGGNQEGCGIGLTVVRDLVEAHGGTVHVKSAGVNRGSQFRVTLPLIHPTL